MYSSSVHWLTILLQCLESLEYPCHLSVRFLPSRSSENTGVLRIETCSKIEVYLISFRTLNSSETYGTDPSEWTLWPSDRKWDHNWNVHDEEEYPCRPVSPRMPLSPTIPMPPFGPNSPFWPFSPLREKRSRVLEYVELMHTRKPFSLQATYAHVTFGSL